MINSDGNNQFKNKEFSFWEWSAPILQSHEELIEKLRELDLVGRTVKNLYCVGMAYNWREDDIGDAIYYVLSEMTPEQRNALPNYRAFLPDGVYLNRIAEIDEPFLIEFEDGDILAIDYSEGSSVRLDMNTVPKSISPGVNRKNINASELFNDILGQEITSVEIQTSLSEPIFTGSHGLTLNEQGSYITGLSLCFNGGMLQLPKNSLYFTSYFDYGTVEMRDQSGKICEINAPEVKSVVKGYIDDDLLCSQDDLDDDCFD